MKWCIRSVVTLAIAAACYYAWGDLNMKRMIEDQWKAAGRAISSLNNQLELPAIPPEVDEENGNRPEHHGDELAKKNGQNKARRDWQGNISNVPIENLNFSERTAKQLRSMGVNSVGDLVNANGGLLPRVHELETISANEVKLKLDELFYAAKQTK